MAPRSAGDGACGEKVGFGGQFGHHGSVPSRRSAYARERRVAVAVLLAAVALREGVAGAAPSEADLKAARALFAAAEADETAGRWADALEKLRRASTVKLTASLRFHIALCEEKTGKLLAAFDDYSAAQAAARVENNREVLALASDPILSIKLRMPTVTVVLPSYVASVDKDTEVRLDGQILPVAKVGAPIPVDVGTHTIQARAAGQTPYAMTFTVVERQVARVDVRFVDHSKAPPPVAAPRLDGATSPPVAAAADLAPHERTSALPAIVSTAGAAALVGLGFVAYAVADGDQSYWMGVCRTQPKPCGSVTAVHAWDATALGAWVAGGAVAVVSVVLWTRHTSAADTTATLGAGPGSLVVAGTF